MRKTSTYKSKSQRITKKCIQCNINTTFAKYCKLCSFQNYKNLIQLNKELEDEYFASIYQ